MMLTFDPAAHQYFWLDKPVVNVTRALSLLVDYSKIPADVLENAKQEGKAIHKTVELHCADDLDEDTLPDWLRPRLDAFKRFQTDTQFKVLASERRVYHPDYGYAGTADLFGAMVVPEGRRSREVIACVDLKRSFAAGRVIGLQVAAYSEAWAHETNKRVARRFALRLRADGTYRCEPFDAKDDFALFLAALSLYKFKESCDA